MIIYVTRKDILQGQQSDCFHCPIALALKRRFKKTVAVHHTNTVIDGIIYDLPPKASQFISRFDYPACLEVRKKLKPFRFNLEIP